MRNKLKISIKILITMLIISILLSLFDYFFKLNSSIHFLFGYFFCIIITNILKEETCTTATN